MNGKLIRMVDAVNRICDECKRNGCMRSSGIKCEDCFVINIINHMPDAREPSGTVWKYRLSYEKKVGGISGVWTKKYSYMIDRSISLERVCVASNMTVTIEERKMCKSDLHLMGRLAFNSKQDALDYIMRFNPKCKVVV